MSSHTTLSKLAVFTLFALVGVSAFAEGEKGGAFYETYKRRSAQRFDLISYLADQKRIRSEQDARYGYVDKGWGFEPDLVLSYFTVKGDVERSAKLGEASSTGGRAQFLLNGLFSEGSKRRLLNVDVGFEAYHRSLQDFKSSDLSQVEFASRETGAGLLLRPFGRSSQDTGLLLKGGYAWYSTKGLWASGTSAREFAAPYWGGEAKLYLLPFLGARAEHTSTFEVENENLAGKWTASRTTYGAFLEFFALSVEAHVFDERYTLKPSVTTAPATKDRFHGIGFMASLYF